MAPESLLEHRAFVLGLCRALLRNPSDAEDAAQQVFLLAFRALRRGVRPLKPKAWLAEIARNECRSRMRTAARRPEASLPDEIATHSEDPVDVAAERVLVERLRQELAGLPERQREAVLLREFRGLSYDEVAAQMHESQPAVESLLQRARRRLVDRLEGSRRSFVSALFARLLAGGGATEAVATGGTAAIVGKVAAVGVVAVAAGSPTADVHRALRPPPEPPARHAIHKVAAAGMPAAVAQQRGLVRHVLRPEPVVRGNSGSSGSTNSSSGSSGPGPSDPEPPETVAVAAAAVTTTRVDNSGPGSSSSGSGSDGHSGPGSASSGSGSSGSSGAGSGESGSGDD